MEYSRGTEMSHIPPPNPNPNPNPQRDLYLHYPFHTRYPIHYSLTPQDPNPNPNPRPPIGPYQLREPIYRIGLEPGFRRPGIDPYLSTTPLPPRHGGGGYEIQSSHVAYRAQPTIDTGTTLAYRAQPTIDTGSTMAYRARPTIDTGARMVVPSGYYAEPGGVGVGVAPNWAIDEVVRRYTTGVIVPPNQALPYPNSTLQTNASMHPHRDDTQTKDPKNMNALQPAQCELCNVECTSKADLDYHIAGKKHKRNFELLTEGIIPGPSATARRSKKVTGPQRNPVKGKAVVPLNTKRTAEHAGNAVTKRRKILQQGTPGDWRCESCNVACNSETVFKQHIAGQKHAAMLKKHAAGS